MMWVIWAILLFGQNLTSTFTSRARNSASLGRHVLASIMSNGVWFAVQIITIGKVIDLMSGKEGLVPAIGTAIFYISCTVLGAVTAHWLALRSERGKSAVGANLRYAQITKDEWEEVKGKLLCQ